MTYDPNIHHRRSVRLPGFDYTNNGAYFVTICTHERLCTLGTVVAGAVDLSRAGIIVQETWQSLSDRFPAVDTDAFVAMPNHVHGVIFFVRAQFIAPEPHPSVQRHTSLGEVVRTFKAASTRAIRTSGNEGFAWQRGYYEHIVRNDADLTRIREYIDANPLRWNEDPENPTVVVGPIRDGMTGRLRAR